MMVKVKYIYEILFEDHLVGEGTIIDPRSIPRMRVERVGVHGLSCVSIRRHRVIKYTMPG